MGVTSDHALLLLELDAGTHEQVQRPFRYELMWESHENFQDTIISGWGAGPPCTSVAELGQKMKDLANDLQRWSRDTFGSVRKEIKKLKLML